MKVLICDWSKGSIAVKGRSGAFGAGWSKGRGDLVERNNKTEERGTGLAIAVGKCEGKDGIKAQQQVDHLSLNPGSLEPRPEMEGRVSKHADYD